MEKTIFTTDGNWLSIKKTDKDFYFTERKGKDSIALFLTKRGGIFPVKVMIRFQSLPLDNTEFQKLYPCPITGSIEENQNPMECAINEGMEEGGYDIKDNIQYLGKYAVGTQTNEVVHMYWADVTEKEPVDISGDGTYHESISKNEWRDVEYLPKCLYSACQIGHPLLIQALRYSYGNII